MSSSKNHDQLEDRVAKKYKKRDRKKTIRMKISGKSALGLQRIISDKSRLPH